MTKTLFPSLYRKNNRFPMVLAFLKRGEGREMYVSSVLESITLEVLLLLALF